MRSRATVVFGILWVLSCFCFLLFVVPESKFIPKSISDSYIGIPIITGVIAWVFMVETFFMSFYKRVGKIIIVLTTILIAFGIGWVIDNANKQPKAVTYNPPVAVVEEKVETNIDPDPIVNCRVTEECGGGTRSVRKSECDNSTCCQIGSTWIFYTSVQKCLEDQKTFKPKTQPQPTYTGYDGKTEKNDYYCYLEATKTWYWTTKEDCEEHNEFSNCIYDSTERHACMEECLDTRTKEIVVCNWAYLGVDGYDPGIVADEDLYNACNDQSDEDYDACLDRCGAADTTRRESCK